MRALHAGVGKNGQPLYPAFPYASYTALSRDDILDIKAYLFSLPTAHTSTFILSGAGRPIRHGWFLAPRRKVTVTFTLWKVTAAT